MNNPSQKECHERFHTHAIELGALVTYCETGYNLQFIKPDDYNTLSKILEDHKKQFYKDILALTSQFFHSNENLSSCLTENRRSILTQELKSFLKQQIYFLKLSDITPEQLENWLKKLSPHSAKIKQPITKPNAVTIEKQKTAPPIDLSKEDTQTLHILITCVKCPQIRQAAQHEIEKRAGFCK
ncbi:hypothetical protein [Aristophania vespae]|uniref:hypothetical protein n=1 Tax=Aristophania vespae TaxID=2697033 RepID=UPI0023515CC6|nr:hypothetical protein [Aristophania vespae]UMM63910.1 hypothetical protein DM15PD_08900 [Aristophania vespae]